MDSVSTTLISAVGYLRVSTPKQNIGHVSIEDQQRQIIKYASENSLILMKIISEDIGAWNEKDDKKRKIWGLVEEMKEKVLVVLDASRFSRNEKNGRELIDRCIRNGITVVFIIEKLVVNSRENIEKAVEYIKIAENESTVKGEKVKRTKRIRSEQGYFTGGRVPYGFIKVSTEQGNVLKEVPYEQNVITFIRLCRTPGTSISIINQALQKITNFIIGQDPIVIDNNETGEENQIILENLSWTNIANILNEYYVLRRGRKWTSGNVQIIRNQEYSLNDICNNMNSVSLTQPEIQQQQMLQLQQMLQFQQILQQLQQSMNQTMSQNKRRKRR